MSIPAAGTGVLGGGISPEQASLAQYTYGQHALGGATRFGGRGTGMSTNETMAGAVGPAAGQTVELGVMSDALAAAQGQFANAQQAASKSITGQQLAAASRQIGKTA